jgi:pimeloyl-ACP methyl ester carboxylesterase
VRSLAVRRGAVRLAARTAGRRGPPLVLVHGLASTQHIWDLVLPLLAARHRVITYDQRGHGASSKPPRGYGFDEVTADLAAVLRACRARRAVVVGHSYGANVALELAARRPEAVAGVVCVDGGIGAMAEVMSWREARRALAPPRLAGMRIERLVAMARAGPYARIWRRRWSGSSGPSSPSTAAAGPGLTSRGPTT